ncbi:integrase core domain-containing protein [uncultured Tateyamaria sp.]
MHWCERFHTAEQAQFVIDIWLGRYNHIQPHQALGMSPQFQKHYSG